MDDSIWQKIFELAVQNTLAHTKRVDILAELFINKIGDKDPVEALKVLREFKIEQDNSLEKLATFSPKADSFAALPIDPKPLAEKLAETPKDKLVELKNVLDKIIKGG